MAFFEVFNAKIKKIKEMGARPVYVGRTVLGEDIMGFHVGSYRGPQIIVQGGIHAREYVTALVVLAQAEEAQSKHKNQPLEGGVYFVPLVNIDGARLCIEGINAVKDYPDLQQELIRLNNSSHDFTMWKANIRGVDLNTNFDALWGRGQNNKTVPGPSDYIGPRPGSEPETQALMQLTERAMPAATVSYHARGREIYWQFYQGAARARLDKNLARQASKITGYKIIDGELNSAGGYKDWCVVRHKIPSLTIEILDENTPFPIDLNCIEDEIILNKDLPLKILGVLTKRRR